MKIVERIGDQIVADRKSALLQEQSSGVSEKLDMTGRDLLTLLVRANLQDADGMSDADIRARKSSPRTLSAPHNLYFFQRSLPSSSLATGRLALP
jgi:hypothetical protein